MLLHRDYIANVQPSEAVIRVADRQEQEHQASVDPIEDTGEEQKQQDVLVVLQHKSGQEHTGISVFY